MDGQGFYDREKTRTASGQSDPSPMHIFLELLRVHAPREVRSVNNIVITEGSIQPSFALHNIALPCYAMCFRPRRSE